MRSRTGKILSLGHFRSFEESRAYAAGHGLNKLSSAFIIPFAVCHVHDRRKFVSERFSTRKKKTVHEGSML